MALHILIYMTVCFIYHYSHRSLCLRPPHIDMIPLLLYLAVDQTSDLWSCLEALHTVEVTYQRLPCCVWVSEGIETTVML